MSKLSDYKLLSFDVYGTLIDWEGGVYDALQPLLSANNTSLSKEEVMELVFDLERQQQTKTPDMKYSKLLATIHPQIASRLGFPAPPAEQSEAFGASVGKWPAFPDTVDALKRLGKFYKLVVLSNVDISSFAESNAGPMEGVKFDLVLTAEEIGSYKPDPHNFEYLVEKVKEKFDIEKKDILHTAQSQTHDHHTAKKMGFKTSWIARQNAVVGRRLEPVFDWKFDTLGAMADALEAELASQK